MLYGSPFLATGAGTKSVICSGVQMWSETPGLESIIREGKGFDKASRRALARLRQGLNLQWAPPVRSGER